MPLQTHHERQVDPATKIPMRRFRDFEPGDTFVSNGVSYMKSGDGNAYPTEPELTTILTPGADDWFREF